MKRATYKIPNSLADHFYRTQLGFDKTGMSIETVNQESAMNSQVHTQVQTEPLVDPGTLTVRRESAMIVLQRGAEAGRRWLLDREEVLSIGRSDECQITLPDRQVSRYHARISWLNDRYQVEDLKSKNGTHVNGEKIFEPTKLEDGDEIQIALRFKLAFVDAGATAPLTIEGDYSGLRLDQETHQVWINGNKIDPPLSLHQYRLLEKLWNSGGSVVTREQIIDVVWPETLGAGVSEQAIDALIRRLRERIAEFDDDFRYIVTVRGHGFRLENR